MKALLLILALGVACANGAGRCTGADGCLACKNCKYCRHCNPARAPNDPRPKPSCSVCRPVFHTNTMVGLKLVSTLSH